MNQAPPISFTSALNEEGVYVTGIVNHTQMSILLDTGSTVSVISEAMWKKSGTTGVNLQPVSGTLTTASGSPITILGQTTMRIRIGNADVTFPMIVASNISHDCLLGSDFLRTNICCIMYGSGTFLIQGSEVPIHYAKQAPAVCRIALDSAVTIPPGTEVLSTGVLASAKLRNTGSPGLVDEAKGVRKKKAVCIARTMIVPRDGKATIRLANFTDRDIQLNKGQVVGQFNPIDHTRAMAISCIDGNSSSNIPQAGQAWHKELNLDKGELTQDQELAFFKIVKEFEDVFARDESDVGLSNLIEHEINIGDHTPIKQQPRRLPPHRRAVVDEQLESLLTQGRIVPSNSPWSSPVVLVRKRNGDFRMCIDYRKLNAVTTKDAQPLPRVDDILESLDGACYFTCLDLASGYWQVRVAEKDRAKTAICYSTRAI